MNYRIVQEKLNICNINLYYIEIQTKNFIGLKKWQRLKHKVLNKETKKLENQDKVFYTYKSSEYNLKIYLKSLEEPKLKYFYPKFKLS